MVHDDGRSPRGRCLAFEVDDLQAALERVAADGYDLVGGGVTTSTLGAWPLCADRKNHRGRADRLTPPVGSLSAASRP